ncbi:MAG TPA: phenylalanine--tRNA ligase subunit beta [Bacteroidales bacterium]|nr:phenylalanine--tRNA ligase subunit beta [Bacteroidales bacterium]
MKISTKWLRRYIETSLDPFEISEILTESGLEVESIETVETIKGGLKGVVIGQVVACQKLPDSDHLYLTQVNIGKEIPLSVVCGAPNVAEGQKVLLATVGTTLYFKNEPLFIKKAKIRGAISEGMICAEDELGLGTSHDGIMILPPDAPIGMPAAQYFHLDEDVVFEIGLTPNRTDATSHIGVARDLHASILARRPDVHSRFQKPSVAQFKIDNYDYEIDIEISDPHACIRYSGITLSNVHVGESPSWLKELLQSVGIRPINNVVDITNFVLMEMGQPLHAFDADKIKGKKVIVKTLPEGTSFTTLDGIERKLDSSDLMICNVKEGMCIAGVFGGLDSGISPSTRNVFIESACFNPSFIRKTSRRHQLFTDASFRYERGSDPDITIYALKRAAILLQEITDAKVSSEIKDVYPSPIRPVEINLRYSQVDRLVGQHIAKEQIRSILQNLEYQILQELPQALRVSVPTCRIDVTREADVIEDVLRIYGYNNVSFREEIHTSLSYFSYPNDEQIKWEIAGMLVGNGFYEVKNNSLSFSQHYSLWSDERQATLVKLFNPLSRELDVMRGDMLPGLLENLAFNLNHQISNLKIFEFGKIYRFDEKVDFNAEVSIRYPEKQQLALVVTGLRENESWEKDQRKADFYYLHAILRKIFQRTGFNMRMLKIVEAQNPFYEQGVNLLYKNEVLAWLGIVSKKMLQKFDIHQEVVAAIIDWDKLTSLSMQSSIEYREIPRFPEVRRDLALLVDNRVKFAEIETLAWQTENRLLRQVNLFDIYVGEKIGMGKKSYAISFILQDKEKTLTDETIEKTMAKLIKAFEQKLGAQLR